MQEKSIMGSHIANQHLAMSAKRTGKQRRTKVTSLGTRHALE